MQKEDDHIYLLITNYLSGEITQTEKDELNRWLNESPSNKQLLEENKRIWGNSQIYFSAVEINNDRNKIKSQINQLQPNPSKKISLIPWIYRVAILLAFPLMIGIGWYLGTSTPSGNGQMCEVTAPKGQISKCVLPDGTTVWLNAGSTIKYNPNLRNDLREVFLDGEAYFNVTKNIHKAFVVNTQHSEVKVLGTVFNLKAYSDENLVETTLEEGSVEFSLKGTSGNKVILKPGEQVTLNVIEKKLTISKVEPYLHTAWKDGKFVFKDANLSTIIQKLEKLYDVRIHVENDSLLKLRFRGMFEYEQNIFSALEALEQTSNIYYRMNGRDIWLY